MTRACLYTMCVMAPFEAPGTLSILPGHRPLVAEYHTVEVDGIIMNFLMTVRMTIMRLGQCKSAPSSKLVGSLISASLMKYKYWDTSCDGYPLCPVVPHPIAAASAVFTFKTRILCGSSIASEHSVVFLIYFKALQACEGRLCSNPFCFPGGLHAYC